MEHTDQGAATARDVTKGLKTADYVKSAKIRSGQEQQFRARRKIKEGKLSAESLRRMLNYDEQTGHFVWLEDRYRKKCKGKIAGSKSDLGYWRIFVNGHLYFAHRLVWLWIYGVWPDHFIDHIDGDACNNRVSNLRDVTHMTNCQNVKRATVVSKTKSLGCFPAKKGFLAQIRIAGKLKHLGTFDTLEKAERSYLIAKRKLHAGCTI